MSEEAKNNVWACVDLMGHVQTASRIEMGALLRVDVPNPDGSYHTEFYGMAAIYSVRIVSEEIARAYAPRTVDVVAYDAPVITMEKHRAAMAKASTYIENLEEKLRNASLSLPMSENDSPDDDGHGKYEDD